ncbi:4700_t:CDS:2, partial [Dentiscutata heterogama]
SKSGLAQEKVINIINKILSNTEDRLERSLFCNNKQWKKHHGIFHNKSETETNSSSSDSESMDSNYYVRDKVKINTHLLQYQSSPPGLLLIPEKAVYLYP